MIVLYASGSLIFQQKTFLDIIMNLPALIFINEIDDYMGTHIIRYINFHHRQIRKDEDFLMFPYCEYIGTLSNAISNYGGIPNLRTQKMSPQLLDKVIS